MTAVDAAAEVGVRNSQPEGIGRVVALGSLLCWNNLGRNVVFADPNARPVAVFGDTAFPHDDEPSQYDLDIHAILDAPELDLVLVLNHLGTVRGFAASDLRRRRRAPTVQPQVAVTFVADAERAVWAAGRLVASRPRADGAVGVVISQPLQRSHEGQLELTVTAEGFGEVTALGVVDGAGPDVVVVGGEGKVAMASVTDAGLAPWRWERDLGFRVATLVAAHGAVWAAGPDPTGGRVDDYDWEQLHGGGFAALDPHDGRVLAHGPLPSGIAWGTGGVAVVPLGQQLAAIARDGVVHLIDPTNPSPTRSTSPLAKATLGIAHAAATPSGVLFGFNRGGYRLHAGALSPPSPS